MPLVADETLALLYMFVLGSGWLENQDVYLTTLQFFCVGLPKASKAHFSPNVFHYQYPQVSSLAVAQWLRRCTADPVDVVRSQPRWPLF